MFVLVEPVLCEKNVEQPDQLALGTVEGESVVAQVLHRGQTTPSVVKVFEVFAFEAAMPSPAASCWSLTEPSANPISLPASVANCGNFCSS